MGQVWVHMVEPGHTVVLCRFPPVRTGNHRATSTTKMVAKTVEILFRIHTLCHRRTDQPLLRTVWQ